MTTLLAGISTACLYPAPTEESLCEIAAVYPACAEVFLNTACELDPPFLRGLRDVAGAAGVAVTSVHPYYSGMEPLLFFSQYRRRFDEGREIYRRFFEAAAYLGADSLVFHGDYQGSRLPLDEYFERYAVLWADAAALGVELCQENVARCRSGRISFFDAMAKALPKARYIFDVKQALRAGEDPFAFVEAMGGRLRHLHVSDHDAAHECLAPGKGVMDIAKLLTLARKNGFDGCVIMELYRENFGEIAELYRSFEHLSQILSTLP